MHKKTVSRANLNEAIFREIGLSRRESSVLVDGVFELLSKELESGKSVRISSFGTFKLRDKARRIGRNPKTKVSAEIKPRRVISFRPSTLMRRRIEKGK